MVVIETNIAGLRIHYKSVWLLAALFIRRHKPQVSKKLFFFRRNDFSRVCGNYGTGKGFGSLSQHLSAMIGEEQRPVHVNVAVGERWHI